MNSDLFSRLGTCMQSGFFFFLEQNYSLARDIISHRDQGVPLGQVLFVVMGIINSGNADQVVVEALLNYGVRLPQTSVSVLPRVLRQHATKQ